MNLMESTFAIHGKNSLTMSGSINWELEDKKSSERKDAMRLEDETIPDVVAPVEAVGAADEEEAVVALLAAAMVITKTPLMMNEM